MNCLKEESDEQSTTEGNCSPKSYCSFQSEETEQEQISEQVEEGEQLFQRVVEWLAQRNISEGDPTAILTDYLNRKKQSLMTMRQSQPQECSASEKGPSLKLRRPLTLKLNTRVG